jgi:hypothetical protein
MRGVLTRCTTTGGYTVMYRVMRMPPRMMVNSSIASASDGVGLFLTFNAARQNRTSTLDESSLVTILALRKANRS